MTNNVLLSTSFDHKKAVKDLNDQIAHLQALLRDSKRIASGEYTKAEIRQDIEATIWERNQLLANI